MLGLLVELELVVYSKYSTRMAGHFFYLEVFRAIYSILVESLFYYRKLGKYLETIGLKFNSYDPCVANCVKSTHQRTIRLHVDDILVLYKDSKVKSEFNGKIWWPQTGKSEARKVTRVLRNGIMFQNF